MDYKEATYNWDVPNGTSVGLKELSPTRFMVYAALSLRADSKTGQCYPTYERIMDDTDMLSLIHI